MGEAAAVAPRPAEGVRPDVLGFPSPRTARYLIFAVALLGAGLFVGNFVHSWTMGDSWQETVSGCEARYGGSFATSLAPNEEFSRCVAPAEGRRVAVSVAGSVAVAVAAALLMWVSPLLVVRRRHLLPLPDRLRGASERFEEMAADVGLAGRVAPLLGPATQRDAFSFGAPGRYRVALPPAVAVRFRDRGTFDPLVGHELAHVTHRDVALAWLARLVWWALAPVLALPLAVGVATRDASILGTYWWRVALLGAVVALLSSDLLRSREHGADLRAARLPAGLDPVVDLVRRTRGPDSSGLKAVLAKHPTTQQRVAVLEDPAVVTRTGFVDGLTGSFLAALALPLVVATLRPLLAPVGRTDVAYLVAAFALGPLLAGAVGLGIWRAALVARVRGESAAALPGAVGVGLGLMLGQAVSLQQAGLGPSAGLAQPVWLLLSGLAGAGATILVAGLGHLYADAAPRLPGVRTAWLLGLVVTSLLFSSLLWVSSLFQTVVDIGGWRLGRAGLLDNALSPWWMFWLVLGVAVSAAAALGLRPNGDRATPEWLLEGSSPARWPRVASAGLVTVAVVGTVAGLAAAAVLVAFRVIQGEAGSDVEAFGRFIAYQWVAAAAAAATVAAGMTIRLHRGAGVGLAAGPVAALVVFVGFLLLNAVSGGSADTQLVTAFLRPAVVLGFYLSMLVAPWVALAGLAGSGRRTGTPGAATVGIPVLLVVAMGMGAVAGAGTLGLRVTFVGQGAASSAPPDVALGVYEATVVPRVTDTYQAVTTLAQRIWEDPTADGAAKAELTSSRVLPALTELLGAMELEQEQVPPGPVAALHQEAVAALRAAVDRYQLLADSGGSLTTSQAAQLQRLQHDESEHWQSWFDQRRAIQDGL